MLTLTFTVAKLAELKLLKAWEPTGGRMIARRFYYSERWSKAVRVLPGKERSHLVKWWDEDAPAVLDEATNGVPEIDLVALDLSERGAVCGLVETFVIGQPFAKLIRKAGFGMDPPFRRMRPPRQAVVEMRTEQTRSFGFVSKGTYVAQVLDLADNTHKNPGLYEIYGDHVMQVMERVSASDKDVASELNELLV